MDKVSLANIGNMVLPVVTELITRHFAEPSDWKKNKDKEDCYKRVNEYLRKADKMKYHNKKVAVDGLTFDSKKEALRYVELKRLASAGAIMNLECQTKFVLIPAQYIDVTDSKGRIKKKLAEREVSYIADFTYYDNRTNEYVVEDVKSPITKTRSYILKRKMLLYFKGLRIHEV